MIKQEFQCFTDDGRDLCFLGGLCTNLTFPSGFTRQVCACPAGFGRDYLLFHSDNCVLPDYALLALFLANLIFSLGYFYALYQVRPRARGRVLRVLNMANVFVFVFCFEMLALYLENGWFIATSIMVAVVSLVICAWGAEMGELVALPLFGMNKGIQARVQRFIQWAFLFFALVNVAGCIALAATSRLEDPIPYNRTVMFYVLSQFLTVVGFGVIVVSYGYQLQRTVDSTELESKQQVHDKLIAMTRGAISIVVGQLPGLVTVVIFWVYGSVPFHWTILFLSFLAMPFSVTRTTLGLFKFDSSTVRESKHLASNMTGSNGGRLTIQPASDSG